MIQNRQSIASGPVHEVALNCLEAAISAADPTAATRSAVSLDAETLCIGEARYELDRYSDIVVVGGGKAAGGVAQTLESVLGERITDGHIVVREPADTDIVRATVGDHPLPSERNVAATTDILDIVDAADAETLVLFVLTGGASALVSAPAGDLTVDDLQTTTERLLAGGVPIADINAVRKHLSDVKGGQVARRGTPATVAGVLLSDVVGNDLSTIGSGPTVPDETTFEDAVAVFDQYDITPPERVQDHLDAGTDGERSETPFEDDAVFDSVQNTLVGDNATALDGAAEAATSAGYEPLVLTSRLRGEAREVAKPLVGMTAEVTASGQPIEPPAVLLAGGETTVTVSGSSGRGGPNQELVLSAAIDYDGEAVIAAVDTDGRDGSSDVAGAIADASTVVDSERAREALRGNDAGSYLDSVDATVQTGPTGTNVNDVVVLVVPE